MNEQSSNASILCRICYDADSREELITPCRCKGTVAYVHRTCLETWLAEANATSCELCHQIFLTERTPKYTTCQSLWKWFRYQPTANEVGRGIIGDMLACAAITPMAVIITYVCLFSSDYYMKKKMQQMTSAKWTSVSLLVMIGIMLIGYYMWVFSIIKLHMKVWYNWWQRECIVRYIAPPIRYLNEPIRIINEDNLSQDSSDATINYDQIELIDIETVDSQKDLKIKQQQKNSSTLIKIQKLTTIHEEPNEHVIPTSSRTINYDENVSEHSSINENMKENV